MSMSSHEEPTFTSDRIISFEVLFYRSEKVLIATHLSTPPRDILVALLLATWLSVPRRE